MAKKFTVELTRTIVEKTTVEVEADNIKDASYRAAAAEKKWEQVQSTERVSMISPV